MQKKVKKKKKEKEEWKGKREDEVSRIFCCILGNVKGIIFKYFKYWIHIVIIFFWIPAVTEWFNLTGFLEMFKTYIWKKLIFVALVWNQK